MDCHEGRARLIGIAVHGHGDRRVVVFEAGETIAPELSAETLISFRISEYKNKHRLATAGRMAYRGPKCPSFILYAKSI